MRKMNLLAFLPIAFGLCIIGGEDLRPAVKVLGATEASQIIGADEDCWREGFVFCDPYQGPTCNANQCTGGGTTFTCDDSGKPATVFTNTFYTILLEALSSGYEPAEGYEYYCHFGTQCAAHSDVTSSNGQLVTTCRTEALDDDAEPAERIDYSGWPFAACYPSQMP